MSLYCEATGYGSGYGYEWDGDGWGYDGPCRYTFPILGRRKPCCSCGSKCKPLTEGDEIRRFRAPISVVECNIFGEDGLVYLSSWYHCEDCSGLDSALSDLGFGYNIGDDLRELVKVEYKAYREYMNGRDCKVVRK